MNEEITTVVGHQLYSFDGRILEVFGNHPKRWHIRHMCLRVTGPDRKGKRTVEITAPGTVTTWQYTAEEWEQASDMVALLEVVQAAIGSASGHGPV
ncbi:hypothetical protein ACGF3G_03315 [Streptomyces sp. NPDC048179]|uniref:hypothetical protein n=1 Tax=Streptomyces sp. NPDC048179 TaxID=3365506 RepID=UPI0037195193